MTLNQEQTSSLTESPSAADVSTSSSDAAIEQSPLSASSLARSVFSGLIRPFQGRRPSPNAPVPVAVEFSDCDASGFLFRNEGQFLSFDAVHMFRQGYEIEGKLCTRLILNADRSYYTVRNSPTERGFEWTFCKMDSGTVIKTFRPADIPMVFEVGKPVTKGALDSVHELPVITEIIAVEMEYSPGYDERMGVLLNFRMSDTAPL